MDPTYRILRPPLHPNFELPTRAELLALKNGDVAKIMFAVAENRVERMWVILQDCSNPEEWTGLLDNDALEPKVAEVLPAGTLVKFHPLDIISIMDSTL